MINKHFPTELWLIIFQMELQPQDLVSLMRVSKNINNIITENQICWSQFLQKKAVQYENPKKEYIQGENVDLNKITISTLLKHPNPQNCYFSYFILQDSLKSIQEEVPNITALQAINRLSSGSLLFLDRSNNSLFDWSDGGMQLERSRGISILPEGGVSYEPRRM